MLPTSSSEAGAVQSEAGLECDWQNPDSGSDDRKGAAEERR
jgi:hypothetical protein